jgi:DNA-3-methyladenine glycosylase II
MKQTLVRRFGGSVAVDGKELSAFPDPETLRRAGRDGLEEAIQNRRKADYLDSVAVAFEGADEGWLRTGPYDEVYDWLTSIRGIGGWSANFVMLRGLGRMERLSEVGAKLVEAVRQVYGPSEGDIDEDRVGQLAAPYGPFQGYWAYYLRINAEFPSDFTRSSPPGSWMSM